MDASAGGDPILAAIEAYVSETQHHLLAAWSCPEDYNAAFQVVYRAVLRSGEATSSPRVGDGSASPSPRAGLREEEAYITYAEVVAELQGCLTHEDAHIRRRATLLLTALMEKLVEDGQASLVFGDAGCGTHMAAMQPLLTFFTSRLADYPSIGPCLRACKVMLEHCDAIAEEGRGAGSSCGAHSPAHHPLPGAVVQVARALFSEVQTQAMEQPLRQAVYSLLLSILGSPLHTQALLSAAPLGSVAGGAAPSDSGSAGGAGASSTAGPASTLQPATATLPHVRSASAADPPFALEFGVGFVNALDGEKDPRCLLLGLRAARLLLGDATAAEGAAAARRSRVLQATAAGSDAAGGKRGADAPWAAGRDVRASRDSVSTATTAGSSSSSSSGSGGGGGAGLTISVPPATARLGGVAASASASPSLPDPWRALGDAVASLTEEVFNVTACYFPIMFTPPPNDPHGITKDALVSALRAVFAATPRLAPFVLPLLLEKASSTVVGAKRDALHTLLHLLPVYGVASLKPFLSDLSSSLKREVLAGTDGSEEGGSGAGATPAAALAMPGSSAAGTPATPGDAPGTGLRTWQTQFPGSIWTTSSAAWSTTSIGMSAGAIGLDFSGETAAHSHSGFCLFHRPGSGAAPEDGGSGCSHGSTPAAGGSSSGSSCCGGGAGSGASSSGCCGGADAASTPLSDEALLCVCEITAAITRASAGGLPTTAGVVSGPASGEEAAAPEGAASPVALDTSPEWTAFAAPLVASCLVELEARADSGAGRASARILCAIAAASHDALRLVLDAVVPAAASLMQDFTVSYRWTARVVIVGLLAGLLHSVNFLIDHPAGQHPLSPHLPALLEVLTTTLTVVPTVPAPAPRRGGCCGGGGGSGGGCCKDDATEGEAAAAPAAPAAPTSSGCCGGKSSSAAGGAPAIPPAVLSALREARCIAAAGLCDLAIRPPSPLLLVEQKIALTRQFTRLLMEDPDDVVRDACLRALCTIASIRQRWCDAVIDNTIPLLMAHIAVACSVALPGAGGSVVAGSGGCGGGSCKEGGACSGACGNAAGTCCKGASGGACACTAAAGPATTTGAVTLALYALAQLACISNPRAQHLVVSQLLSMALVSQPCGGERPRVVMRAPAPAWAGLAVPSLILETLGRVVAAKCRAVLSGSGDPELAPVVSRNGFDPRRAVDAFLALQPGQEAVAALPVAPDGVTLPLVPAFYSLLVDSVRPPVLPLLPFSVRAATEVTFRSIGFAASLPMQTAFRAAVVDALLNGCDAGAASSDAVLVALPAAPWFTPLAAGAPVSQMLLLPPLLKVVACAERGSLLPRLQALLPALLHAVFAVPCGPLTSCDDPQQRLTAAGSIVPSLVDAACSNLLHNAGGEGGCCGGNGSGDGCSSPRHAPASARGAATMALKIKAGVSVASGSGEASLGGLASPRSVGSDSDDSTGHRVSSLWGRSGPRGDSGDEMDDVVAVERTARAALGSLLRGQDAGAAVASPEPAAASVLPAVASAALAAVAPVAGAASPTTASSSPAAAVSPLALRLVLDLQRTVVIMCQTIGVSLQRWVAREATEGGLPAVTFKALLQELLLSLAARAQVAGAAAPVVSALAPACPPSGLPAVPASPRATDPVDALTRVAAVLVWAAKGLHMRAGGAVTTEGGLNAAAACTHALACLALDDRVAALACRGLGLLVADTRPGHPFSREAGVAAPLLYKHKVFSLVTSEFKALVPSSSATSGAAATTTTSGSPVASLPPPPPPSPLLLGMLLMATQLPLGVLLGEGDTVLPLAILALSRAAAACGGEAPPPPSPTASASPPSDEALTTAALGTLRTFVAHSPSSVAMHVHSLVPALLALAGAARRSLPEARCLPGTGGAAAALKKAANAGQRVALSGSGNGAASAEAPSPVTPSSPRTPRPSPFVRAAAIDTLRSFVGLPYHRLHPLHGTVIGGLAHALDDPKRAVRRRAAAARNEWASLVSGGGGRK